MGRDGIRAITHSHSDMPLGKVLYEAGDKLSHVFQLPRRALMTEFDRNGELQMLLLRYEGVTEAAGKLQRRGVIDYHRGKITVLDRPRLERLSCECYGVVKMETDRLSPHG